MMFLLLFIVGIIVFAVIAGFIALLTVSLILAAIALFFFYAVWVALISYVLISVNLVDTQSNALLLGMALAIPATIWSINFYEKHSSPQPPKRQGK